MTRHPSNRPYRCPGFFVVAWLFCAVIVLTAFGQDDEKVAGKSAEPVPIREIENVFRLTPRLYSGGQPEGDAAFERLKALGIRTIITVDGAKPDLARAKKYGMRYVHLPIGYDAVPADKALLMAKAAGGLPGPVFVHCHHGKHRGPAAAAFCAIATEGWSREKGLEWMRRAGTSPDYAGLFQSVKSLPIPSAEQLKDLPAEFPEVSRVSTLVESMVQVDREWDRLKAARERKFAKTDGDDVTPTQMALQLTELFRELARSEEAEQRGKEFVEAARSSEKSAERLEQALRKLAGSGTAADRDAAETQFRAVSQSCTACHKKHRDDPNRD